MRSWLDKVCALRIKTWRYIREIDPTQKEHIGPMADEWAAIMGIGDGVSIDTVDAVGICLKAIQELRAEVAGLRAEIDALRRK